MTTASFPVSLPIATVRLNAFLARLVSEVSAFFEEMHAAQVRAGQVAPFGL